ncbi:nickel-dependent hydrogenase large subunit [Fundidesulfovibrio soli]|uniref:hydrogenase large subunit n=1 Tax=Fundidesulfovibrio soli TaxID=2922716 RepID=UPI001FAE89F2|nr:nickel-dependent hydrogenase large subunit [Fundidesulfovibrio soli]
MRTILPFGPQHPVLPEPIHLKLVVEEEKVVEALPNLGYVHRGLEKLTDIRDYNQMVNIVERVCGICSCIHALNFCEAVEEMMKIEVPQRAHFLRVMWSEIHRIHSHLLWLGLFADGFGFESLFMQLWRIRERSMDLMEATAGNRVVISTNIVGGVRKDITGEQKTWILAEIDKIEAEVRQLEKTLLNDYTVKSRCCGKGVLTKEQAHQLGAVGPMLRGSGWAQDVRMTGYAAYGQLDFEPVVEHDGDSYARCVVRFREVYTSCDLVRQVLAKLPDGELAAKFKAKPEGEVWRRVEQPRGELFYYIKGNGSKFLERVRIRTPTFANIPPLLAMLPGCDLADVPIIVLSIDPCISCTER